MAKLKADAINTTDLIEYIETQSDLSFEMQILQTLFGLGFEIEHGGTYIDPHTKKPREFDLRAHCQKGVCTIRLAVECKNLRENFPLLLTCVPRRNEEAFSEIVLALSPDFGTSQDGDDVEDDHYDAFAIPATAFDLTSMEPKLHSFRLTSSYCRYKMRQPVAKSCEQVGRNTHGLITSEQSGIYDKWSQALSSSDELIELAFTEYEKAENGAAFTIVLPVVVVPNDRLWVVQFDENGNRIDAPKPATRSSYYVNRSYAHRAASLTWGNYTVSHLEFVTEAGLGELVNELRETDWEDSFPIDHIVNNLLPKE